MKRQSCGGGKAARKKQHLEPKTLGPVSDLERHLPSQWWQDLFNSVYLKTDGDVVENEVNTRQDIDRVLEACAIKLGDRVLDLCCGQGRHSMELARRGFGEVTGMDRSRYLIRLARARAKSANLGVRFSEGDARKFRRPKQLFDCVMLMGNSFGYFEQPEDDEAVLGNVFRALVPGGKLFMDITDGEWMKANFEARSWEWIDQQHFVCRERSLARDNKRLISREVVSHAEKGVLVDQFYAERLYTLEDIRTLLKDTGFTDITLHEPPETCSTRNCDLGLMQHRMFITARTPDIAVKAAVAPATRVTVLLGDPRLGDPVKLGGQFNTEDFQTIERMQQALGELDRFNCEFMDDHSQLLAKLQSGERPAFVFNLCDEGYRNNAFHELHVPAVLEMLDIPYTGAGPACLGLCYNKGLVRAIAQSLDVPVPHETQTGALDKTATLPTSFPVLVKPNFGDSSIGITQHAVVRDQDQLIRYLEWLRATYGRIDILLQEYLCGEEYSVGIVGNPGLSYKVLAPLEVDFSLLPPDLPPILGYESKWDPESVYWNKVRYKPAELDPESLRLLLDHSNLLFERLGCRDYARFDFRRDSEGVIKLMEVNPNPGWCWDGKMNIMAGFENISYAELLEMILAAALERYGD